MASNVETEIFQLLYQEQGADAVLVQGRKKLQDLRDWMEFLRDAYAQGAATQDEFADGMRKAAGDAGKLQAELKRLEAAAAAMNSASASTAAGVDVAAKSTKNLGQVGLQAGRILQDFTQGGIGGILNNVEGFAMAMGGGAGVAGLLTGVGVAAFIAKPYLVSAAESIGLVKSEAKEGQTEIERLKDRIKELNDRPIKPRVDRNELQALEGDLKKITAAQEAYNQTKGLRTKAETEALTAANEAIREAGGPEVTRALEKPGIDRVDTDNPGVRDALDRVKKLEDEKAQTSADIASGRVGDIRRGALRLEELDAAIAAEKARLSDLRDAAIQAAKDQAGALLALKDAEPGKLTEKMQALARALREAGRGDVAHDIEQVTPDQIRKSEEAGEAIEKLDVEGSGKQAHASQAEIRRETEKRRNKIAQAVEDWALRQVLESGKFTVDQLQAFLLEGGHDPDAVAFDAEAVMKKLQESVNQRIDEKRADLGADATAEDVTAQLLGEMEVKRINAAKKTAEAREAAAQTKQDKADSTAENKADKFERDQAEAARKAREKEAGQGAATYGPGLMGEVEAAMVQNRMAARPLDDLSLRMQLNGQISERLRQAGARDADGNVLTPRQRSAVAREILDRAQQDLSKKTLELQEATGGAMSGIQVNQQLLVGLVDRAMQQQAEIMAQNARVQQQIRGASQRNTALRRAAR